MTIDKNTKEFLKTLQPNKNPVLKILKIYKNYESFDITLLSLQIVEKIFNDVVIEFYPGLMSYIVSSKKKDNINFVNKPGDCSTISAILEALAYDSSDTEINNYDFGIVIALDCLNSLNGNEILYSGGYITKSRVIFIILMLLHEIIHLIEYTDSYLSTATDDHIIFFYKTGFKVFGLISRLSEITDIKSLNFTDYPTRMDDIQRRIRNKGDLINGSEFLGDFSHYNNVVGGTDIFNGYITYDMFNNSVTGIQFIGGRRSKYFKKYTKKFKKNIYNKSKYRKRR
jgi:hypothetical protein